MAPAIYVNNSRVNPEQRYSHKKKPSLVKQIYYQSNEETKPVLERPKGLEFTSVQTCSQLHACTTANSQEELLSGIKSKEFEEVLEGCEVFEHE